MIDQRTLGEAIADINRRGGTVTFTPNHSPTATTIILEHDSRQATATIAHTEHRELSEPLADLVLLALTQRLGI